MPACAMVHCKNYNRHTKGTSVVYHSFPRDATLREIWKLKCMRKDDFNLKNSRICSDHFSPEDYVRDLKGELLGEKIRKKRLKPDAVPSQNLPLLELHSVVNKPSLEKKKEIRGTGCLNDNCELITDVTLCGNLTSTDLEIDVSENFLQKSNTSMPCNSTQMLDNLVAEGNSVLDLGGSTDAPLKVEAVSSEIFDKVQDIDQLIEYCETESRASLLDLQKFQTNRARKNLETKRRDLELKDPLLENSRLNTELKCLRKKNKMFTAKLRKLKKLTKLQADTLWSKTEELSRLSADYVQLQAKMENLEKSTVGKVTERVVEILNRVFTRKQIQCLLANRTNVHWDEEDYRAALSLLQISKPAYIHLRKNTKIPLPSLESIKRWQCMNASVETELLTAQENPVVGLVMESDLNNTLLDETLLQKGVAVIEFKI